MNWDEIIGFLLPNSFLSPWLHLFICCTCCPSGEIEGVRLSLLPHVKPAILFYMKNILYLILIFFILSKHEVQDVWVWKEKGKCFKLVLRESSTKTSISNWHNSRFGWERNLGGAEMMMIIIINNDYITMLICGAVRCRSENEREFKERRIMRLIQNNCCSW